MPIGHVITVFRGGCQVVCEGRSRDLKLRGRHAEQELALAVGDEISFDPDRGIVLERRPRRTRLARRRGRGEQVIAANMDQLAVVTSFLEPGFRPGLVDRFWLAARAGGLEAILVVNKRDLLEGAPIPESVRAYESLLPVHAISALTGEGVPELRERLRGLRTVLAGHSGVGKSSLLNALEPELRLETGTVTAESKGRHTTARSIWIQLEAGTVVVDTPGVREIATGPVDPSVLAAVYADLVSFAEGCRFRDCRHEQEPDCAVRAAIDAGELAVGRLASYRRLTDEIEEARRARSRTR